MRAASPVPMVVGDQPLPVDQRSLRTLQLERLRWTLRRAYDVPGYRRAFDKDGVRPDACRALEDLKAFPFTTKDDLRDGYPFGLLAVPRESLRRVHASSGTTGRPTVIGYTQRDLDTWSVLMARSMAAAGVRPGDLVHNAYGYGLFTGGLGAHYGAERLGCTVVPASGGMTERQARLIRDLRPRVVMATPSYLLALLDELERQGSDPRHSSLQIAILGAEPWTEELRHEIEKRGGLRAVDIYGLSEMMGPGVAQEPAETQDGLHLWEDHFWPEIVDPRTGKPLPDGEHGELVLTTLTREAQPLVRYRTRDMTRLLPATASPVRRLQRITGRSDDMLILRGVNVYPSQVEELLLAVPGLSPHYQLVLSREGALDTMLVRVESRLGWPERERSPSAERLRRTIKESVGVTVACDVVEPGSIERSAGKAVRVLDLRRSA